MGIWVADLLPLGLIRILPAITLIVVGLIVEKRYVGRIAIFANAVALSTFFAQISNVPTWAVIYINFLTVAGLLALFSYAFKIKLPKEFYFIAGMFSSLVSGIMLFWGLTLQ